MLDAYFLHVSLGLMSADLVSPGICNVAHGKPSVQRDLKQTGDLSW